MESKIKISVIFNFASNEFIKWVTNPRIVIVGILITFIHSFTILPMLEHAQKYGESLNVLEPFIAVGNSGMLALFMPIVFIILISDFPKMDGNTVLYIYRIGKYNWFLGQMLFIIFAILGYITVILSTCIFMSNGNFSINWSNTITKYDATFPDEAGSFVSRLIPSNLYNQLSLLKAFVFIVLLLILYLFAIALIISVMKLLYLKTAGLFMTIAFVSLGAASCSLKTPVMWFFPTANTMIWMHYDELRREPITPISTSFIYFIIIITLLIVANIIILCKMQFINIGQEEM